MSFKLCTKSFILYFKRTHLNRYIKYLVHYCRLSQPKKKILLEIPSNYSIVVQEKMYQFTFIRKKNISCTFLPCCLLTFLPWKYAFTSCQPIISWVPPTLILYISWDHATIKEHIFYTTLIFWGALQKETYYFDTTLGKNSIPHTKKNHVENQKKEVDRLFIFLKNSIPKIFLTDRYVWNL